MYTIDSGHLPDTLSRGQSRDTGRILSISPSLTKNEFAQPSAKPDQPPARASKPTFVLSAASVNRGSMKALSVSAQCITNGRFREAVQAQKPERAQADGQQAKHLSDGQPSNSTAWITHMRIWAPSRATFSTSRLMARSVASAMAKAAGLSRSDFFERFRRQAGRAPVEYATEWRLAVAKTLLRQGG
ncbi:hypothetical protein DSM109990_00855 [Sulfitobacter dubius]|uniref:HTH araC/xylS-type domain-containing protein n=2 Tax=Roseobacteraceae TaxID=2854170 RepID=A0ABY3ZHD3_9RHOB|nr:hypothetical protein DSM109990_00855 [Sulfitobacter dubius]